MSSSSPFYLGAARMLAFDDLGGGMDALMQLHVYGLMFTLPVTTSLSVSKYLSRHEFLL